LGYVAAAADSDGPNLTAERRCLKASLYAIAFCADGDSSNTERVRAHYVYLVDNLDLKFCHLLDRLYCDGVVDSQEMNDIDSQPTNARQNEKLLCLLSHKSADQFQIFLQDLDRSAQRHIRNTLENRQGFTDLLLHSTSHDEKALHAFRNNTFIP